LVLYELLTSRYPIQGRDPSSIIAGHLFRQPLDFKESDPGGRIPEGLRAMVLKALAKAPADRYATAQDMSRALTPFRSPDDVSDADLQRVLSAPVDAAFGEHAVVPGSTQKRLDEQFGLNATPRPRTLEAVPSDPGSPAPAAAAGEAALEVIAATIELQLQKGGLLEAETELRSAVETFGEKPELRTLRDRLEGQRQRAAELAADELVREARERFEAGDLEDARERLSRARSLDPDHAEAPGLLVQIGEAERRRNEEARREREVAGTLERIDAALERGQSAEAEALLFEAEATLGRQEAFAVRYERLEELRRREMRAKAEAVLKSVRQLLEAGELDEAEAELQRARRLDAENAEAATLAAALAEARRRRALDAEVTRHIATARELAAAQDFKGALREVRQAAKAAPDHPVPPVTLAEIEAAQARIEEKRRRADRIARAVSAVDKKLQRGDLAAADKLLTEAEAAEGPAPELADLRQRLLAAQQAAEQEARERREREEKRAAEAAAVAEAERLRREEERRRQEDERKRRAEEEKKRAEELRREKEARAKQTQVIPRQAQPEPVVPPAPVPLAPPQPAANSRPLWIGAGVLVLGLAIFLGWWLSRGPAGDQKEAPAVQTEQTNAPSPPAGVATGVLVVDAVPWGEIVEIVDGQGTRQPLGAERNTPLALTLPPGHYTITLRNPHFPQPVSLTAEVLAGAEVRGVAEIGRLTEEELFRALGW
jgi:hypothetical protein